jgi:predicted ArsR family transcriptional regulator
MCPASVLLDPDLSDKAARVFGVLALRAFGKSTVALSREELSASLRCSESAAKRAISELAERGHIEIVRTHKPSELLRAALHGIRGCSRSDFGRDS